MSGRSETAHVPASHRASLHVAELQRSFDVTRARLDALEEAQHDDEAPFFATMEDWDAQARAALNARLRDAVAAFADACLDEQPRTRAMVRSALALPERAQLSNVVSLQRAPAPELADTSLLQVFFCEPDLEDTAQTLAREGIFTFGQLDRADYRALRAMGLSLQELELLDRACASVGLRIKGWPAVAA